jgi:hypothetical protein
MQAASRYVAVHEVAEWVMHFILPVVGHGDFRKRGDGDLLTRASCVASRL